MARSVGRPKIELTEDDWIKAGKMAYIWCTGEEIADVLGMSYDTLEKRVIDKGYESFTDWYKKHESGGKMALRRYQMKQAEKSAAMAIWLGKQKLGQKDRYEQDITHQGGITLAYNLDYEPKEVLVGSNSEQLEEKTDKKED